MIQKLPISFLQLFVSFLFCYCEVSVTTTTCDTKNDSNNTTKIGDNENVFVKYNVSTVPNTYIVHFNGRYMSDLRMEYMERALGADVQSGIIRNLIYVIDKIFSN